MRGGREATMARDGSGASGSPAEFDFDRLASISDGDDTFEREIARDYLAQARELVTRMGVSLERGDAPALQRDAHTLKGSSRTIGAEGLGSIGAEIERLAAGPDPTATRAALARGQSCLVATEQRLDDYFGTDDYRKAA
jgi:two-component system sensor histidine kinase EvgS